MENVGKIYCQRGDADFDWKVQKFSSLSAKTDSWYDSRPFEFGGRSWYLQLCPNGERCHKSQGYISLYLIPTKTGPPIDVLFSLGVKTAKGETELLMSDNRTFKWKDKGWGGSECILRSELFRRRDELLPLDVLTITVTCKTGMPREGIKDESVQTEVEHDIANDEKGGPTEKAGTKNVLVQTEAEHNAADVSVQTLFENNVASVSVQTEDEENAADDRKDESLEKTGGEKILQDVRTLWTSGDKSDVIIRVKDVEFKAHKTILAARTPVLGAMFHHDTTEKNSGEVTIEDCEPAVFEQLLHYIYTGAPRVLTAENASALYVVADKYLVSEVKALCVRSMKNTLCLNNFCNIVTLSLMYRENELLEMAISFLSKNVVDVMKTVEWQMFMAENSTWANEILIRALDPAAHAFK